MSFVDRKGQEGKKKKGERGLRIRGTIMISARKRKTQPRLGQGMKQSQKGEWFLVHYQVDNPNGKGVARNCSAKGKSLTNYQNWRGESLLSPLSQKGGVLI